jgi:hypothetical protein
MIDEPPVWVRTRQKALDALSRYELDLIDRGYDLPRRLSKEDKHRELQRITAQRRRIESDINWLAPSSSRRPEPNAYQTQPPHEVAN